MTPTTDSGPLTIDQAVTMLCGRRMPPGATVTAVLNRIPNTADRRAARRKVMAHWSAQTVTKPRRHTPRLLDLDAAVELLTVARKTRPPDHRVTAVLGRLVDQTQRDHVVARVAGYWAPLPARAKARRPRRVVEAWGPGVQLELLPVGEEVGF